MRKKFIKSSRPTYKKRIRKSQQGMKFVSYNPISNPITDYTDITNPINPFSEYNFNTTYDKPEALVVPTREDSKPDTVEEPDVVANNPTVEPVINKPVASKVTYTPKSYKGLAAFNKAYDEVEASNPEAKKYRQFLTKMAEQESGFNSAIQNRAGAPAYGYFQFMQDDKKYNNIRQYAGTDIETFRNNPKLQIEAAIKLAKSFEKGFSKEDLELANKNGYSTWGLLGGAWLAGNGGVRKFLRGQGNPSDRHWSKEGKGTDVATRIKAFNFKEGGIIKYQEPAHGIARRDATYVAPKMYAPRPHKTKEEEIIEQNRNSEMISIPAHSTIGMVDGKLQVIDTPARQIPNVGAGYLSGTDPVGEFVVGNVVAGKPLMWLGKGVDYGANKAISKWIKNRTVGKAIKNSEVKVPTKPLPDTKPLSNPYPIIGTADEVAEEYMNVSGTIFGSPIAKRSEQAVFNHATDPTKVVKIYAHNNKGFRNMNELKAFMPTFAKRNKIPFVVKNEPIGYVRGKDGIFPVSVQDKVTPLKAMDNATYEREILPELVKQLKAKGYTQTSPDVFSNGKFKITDLFPDNMGYDGNGNLVFFDAKVYRLGGLLGTRHK